MPLKTAVVSLMVLALAGPAAAQAAPTYTGSFGSAGTEGGQFGKPAGVAVNAATGDVYVADATLNRVSEFSSAGAFIRTWGKNVDETTGGNVCTAASGDTCQAGISGSEGGALSQPQGVAVNSSTGAVYVEDAGNNRVEMFDSGGAFVLTWGKAVDQQTGANICTAASGHTCRAGALSGAPKTPTEDGAFNGLGGGFSVGSRIAVDEDGFVYVADENAVPFARIQKFDETGHYVSRLEAPSPTEKSSYITQANDLSLDSSGNAFITVGSFFRSTLEYGAEQFGPEGKGKPIATFGSGHNVTADALDPATQFLFTIQESCESGSGTGIELVEFDPRSRQEVDCTDMTESGIAVSGGTAISPAHSLYVTNPQAARVDVVETPTPEAPVVASENVSGITAAAVDFEAGVASNLAETTTRFEYGTSPCSGGGCSSTPESESIGTARYPQPASGRVEGLQPDTLYYYRVVAHNDLGTTVGAERTFRTYPSTVFDASCENNLARQQTGAGFLLDCRAYELVSAQNTGGYNVESDLVPGESPFPGFPAADGKALYAVHDGGIPGTGKPTNRGLDPYVATRDAANRRWVSKYVGVPADAPSNAPFSSEPSGVDAHLGTFAFGGADTCDPCFADGSGGIPVRLPNGELVQGMAGSLPVASPTSAGEVKKPLSADGTHFVFGSTQQFEPNGNDTGTDVTLYERDLGAGTTEVVSVEGGTAIAAGEQIAELDISDDGSVVVYGVLDHADAAGNRYWHLYAHEAGSPDSIDLTPGTGEGALYDGMTADGSTIYFTSRDSYADDSDGSADIFGASLSGGSATLSRISTGAAGSGNTDACDPAGNSYDAANWNVVPGGPTDCSVVAIAGGGGVAADSGSIYFLSPELLAGPGSGVEGAPNLFVAGPGSAPEFVATLESGANSPVQAGSHQFETSFGSFVKPEGGAIDHSDGSYYVFDPAEGLFTPAGSVRKFDSSGNAVLGFGNNGAVEGFVTVAAPFEFAGVPAGLGIPAGIAVDNNPSSPNYRDVFVPDLGQGGVVELSPNGSQVGLLEAEFPLSVAIQPGTGRIYIGAGLFGPRTVQIFEPDGTFVSSFAAPAQNIYGIGVDSSGHVYLANGSSVLKYSSAGTAEGTLDSHAAYGVTVDPTDDHVYVDEGERIVEYDPSGTQVGSAFGGGHFSQGVGVAAYGGRVLVPNRGGGNAVVYGPAATPPSRAYDSPLVIDSVKAAEARKTADFQVTPDGGYAAFASTLPLTGFEANERYEVYRYASQGQQLDCVSCNPTLASPTTDSSLAAHGSSLTEDGRVFFDSGESLSARDSNSRQDAYEWSKGVIGLISTGQSGFDAGLLSVTLDGTDAFFFTRATLVAKGDENGSLMKLYDARSNGGFFIVPESPPCAASDECHGPGSPVPPPPTISTVTGSGGNFPEAPPHRKCRKGVRRHGKCVKRKHHKRHRHHRRHGHA